MTDPSRRSVLRGIGALGVSSGLALTSKRVAGQQSGSEDVIYIEAETAKDDPDFSPFVVGSDSDASNGEYIFPPDGNDSLDAVPESGRATYEFTVDETASYLIEGRIRAAGSGSDSLYVSLDDGDFVPWYFDLSDWGSWEWDHMLSSSAISLSEGAHSLTLAYREDMAELDQIRITKSDEGDDQTTAPGASSGVQTVSDEALGSNRRPNTFGLYDSSVDKTFISYMGSNSNPYVQSYDHESANWSDPKRAVDASVGLDLHNYPMMIQSDDGKIQLFYSEHNEMLYHATSSNVSSIEGSWTENTISAGAYATYPFPVKSDKGDIFVFYRETTQNDPDSGKETDYRPLQYVRSTDNGQTWSNNKSLTGTAPAIGHTRDDNLNEIYLGQVRREPATSSHPERFHLVWTLAGGGPAGHEHDRYHEHVYHAYFVPSELEFYAMDGTNLGHHLDDVDSEKHCKVYDTGEPTNPETSDDPFDIGYRHLVHYTKSGHPIVIFEHTSMGLVSSRWTGGKWKLNSTDLPEGGIGDMERIGPQSFRFYATASDVSDVMQVFETHDGGKSWAQVDTINYPTSLHYTVNILSDYKSPAKLMALQDGGGNVYISGNEDLLARQLPSSFNSTVGERITFDVEDTSGKDRWIEALEWDFGDDTTASGWWNEHRYDEPGIYTVTLTATANTGYTSNHEVVITIDDLSDTIAKIQPSTEEIEVGERITFEVKDNSGEDRWIESLEWNFGDDTTASGWWNEHRYEDSGTYTVALTATDNTGQSTTHEVSISVI